MMPDNGSRNNLNSVGGGIDLFSRVAAILEQARANVVRSVNANMVLAYWLIGREIVQELQKGEERAEYGKQVLECLSVRLTGCYGKGFSVTNLKYFRLFYQVYPHRLEIRHPAGDELEASGNDFPDDCESPDRVMLHSPEGGFFGAGINFSLKNRSSIIRQIGSGVLRVTCLSHKFSQFSDRGTAQT